MLWHAAHPLRANIPLIRMGERGIGGMKGEEDQSMEHGRACWELRIKSCLMDGQIRHAELQDQACEFSRLAVFLCYLR